MCIVIRVYYKRRDRQLNRRQSLVRVNVSTLKSGDDDHTHRGKLYTHTIDPEKRRG